MVKAEYRPDGPVSERKIWELDSSHTNDSTHGHDPAREGTGWPLDEVTNVTIGVNWEITSHVGHLRTSQV